MSANLSKAFQAFDTQVVTLRKIIEDISLNSSKKSTYVAFLNQITKEKNEIEENEEKIRTQNRLQASLEFLEVGLKPLREKANQLERLPEENKKLEGRLDDLKRKNRRLRNVPTTQIFELVHGRPSPLFNL